MRKFVLVFKFVSFNESFTITSNVAKDCVTSGNSEVKNADTKKVLEYQSLVQDFAVSFQNYYFDLDTESNFSLFYDKKDSLINKAKESGFAIFYEESEINQQIFS